jgi:peptide/nickel transport system substrate-binding protein
MTTRRSLLATAMAAPALLSGPVRAQGDTRPVLRVAVQALPPTLDPVESISNVGLRITDNVFDTLIRRDFLAEAATGQPTLVPALATSLVQRDALTWEATVRPGVRLHDGGELTAEDIAATFAPDRLWGPKAPFFEGKISWGHLDSVTAEGRDRVIIRTQAPDVVMPQRLAAYAGWIGSAKHIAETGLEGMRTKPVGSGPYRLTSFQRDQRVVMTAFDEYWMGRPAAKQTVLQVVPEASARLAGLQAGDFDMVTNLLPDQAPVLARDPKNEAVSVTMDLAHILYYDTRQPVLADRRVRQGLNFAIDYDLLRNTLWGPGIPRMAALQVPSWGGFYDAKRPGFSYDPARARELLAAGGYRGQEIVVRIPAGYYLNLLPAAQIVLEMWRAVGVAGRLDVRETVASLAQPGADVRPTSVAFRFADPLGGGLLVHLSKSYSLQQQGYWQPARFNAISDAMRAAIEPAERQRLWAALLDEYEAEAPALILYPVQEVLGKRRNIRFTHYPLYYMDCRPYNLSYT